MGLGTGGLGLKRREAEKEAKEKEMSQGESLGGKASLRKAKTLSEKRYFLQQDIMKYGVAAIEKMYPRQPQKRFQKQSPAKPIAERRTPVKMKPKPIGFDFDEVDVRKILRPNSHSKYIHEPAFDSVVFIERPKGIVPLSSLCPTSSTIMPSNCSTISTRNSNFGKPKLFIQDKGRLVAIGGSRDKSQIKFESVSKPIKVLRTPKIPVIDAEGRLARQDLQETFVPFQMSSEYAGWAVAAVDQELINDSIERERQRALKGQPPKVDIRVLKKREKARKLANQPLKSVLESEKKSITNHLMEKISAVADATEAEIIEAEKEAEAMDVKVEVPEVPEIKEEPGKENDDKENVVPDQEVKKEEEGAVEEDPQFPSSNPTHNLWSDDVNHAPLPDLINDRPFISESFKLAMEERKKKELAGELVIFLGLFSAFIFQFLFQALTFATSRIAFAKRPRKNRSPRRH